MLLVGRSFSSGKTRSYEWRKAQLTQLKNMMSENEEMLIQALRKDLGRSNFECVGLELVPIAMEVQHAIDNLRSWMKCDLVPVPVFMAPASCEIHHDAYGVCLVISAFNYPFELALGPLIGAIAAGNCTVIKPSELAPACEEVMKFLLEKYLDQDCFSVVCGGVDVTTQLLDQQWDKIFFTGSPRVGKIVMAAAAKNLTPVSLELGGKSPVIVDNTITDIELVTRRIMWGKCANAGQTCIAPDYILCHESMYDILIEHLIKTLGKFYGQDIQSSKDFARIISETHCQRLKGLLDESKAKIIFGGQVDVSTKYFQPTIVGEIDLNSRLMREEIFGPILPVIKFKDISEIQKIIAVLEKPLSMYIFSKNRKFIDTLIETIPSGSLVVNDTLLHFANPNLPFGGIGDSGLGAYHGKYSFEAFTHKRSVMRRDDHSLLDVSVRYPPYTVFGENFFKFVCMKIPSLPAVSQGVFWMATGAAASALAVGVAMFITRK